MRAIRVHTLEVKPNHWRIRLRVPGRPDRYRYHDGGQAEATTIAGAWLVETEGTTPAITDRTKLGPLLRMLVGMQGHLAERTLADYRFVIDRFIDPPKDARQRYDDNGYVLGQRRIGELRPADWKEFHWLLTQKRSSRGGHPVGPRTIKKICRLARWGLSEATKVGAIPTNPFAEMKVRERRAEVIAPPPAALEVIQRTMPDDWRVGLLLRLALASGARRGELLALRWDHVRIDFDAPTILIEHALILVGGEIKVKGPKTASGRREVKLPAEILPELRAARARAAAAALAGATRIGELPVFPGDGGPATWWNPDTASQKTRRALMAANVPGSLHGLRHAHATTLLRARVNPPAVKARLGHATMATTLALYAHTITGDDTDAAAVIGAAMRGRRAG